MRAFLACPTLPGGNSYGRDTRYNSENALRFGGQFELATTRDQNYRECRTNKKILCGIKEGKGRSA